MTINRGLGATFGCTLLFGSLGAGIGWLLARFTPDYYRFVFRIPLEAGLSVEHAGFALGLVQGILVGAAVGLVLTGIVAWYELQRQRASAPGSPSGAN